jgi:hypothetical protein
MQVSKTRVIDYLVRQLAARRALAMAQRSAYRRLMRAIGATAPVQQQPHFLRAA